MAKWIGFHDGAGRERPREGPTSVEDVASHQPQVVGSLRAQAMSIGRRADMYLDVHPKERTGASQIDVQQGKLDFYVMLIDETHASAASIEKNLGILRSSMNKK